MLYRFRQRRRLLKKKSVKTQTAVLTILSCIKRTGRSTSPEGLIPARPHLDLRSYVVVYSLIILEVLGLQKTFWGNL